MAAGLGLVVTVVLTMFGTFVVAVGYAQWATKDVVLTKGQ